MVTHAVMREAVGGTTDAGALTELANGYARAAGGRDSGLMEVSIEPAECTPSAGAEGMVESITDDFSPGMRLRVRTAVFLPGFLGKMWRNGIQLESTVVVLPDPWKGCLGWLKGLLGLNTN